MLALGSSSTPNSVVVVFFFKINSLLLIFMQILPLEDDECSLAFNTGFKMLFIFFSHIYTFPVDTMLAEFAT